MLAEYAGWIHWLNMLPVLAVNPAWVSVAVLPVLAVNCASWRRLGTCTEQFRGGAVKALHQGHGFPRPLLSVKTDVQRGAFPHRPLLLFLTLILPRVPWIGAVDHAVIVAAVAALLALPHGRRRYARTMGLR